MSIQRKPSNVAREFVRRVLPKEQPRRRRPNRDGFTTAVKQIIERRSAGMCERDFCGPADHHHHRAPRGRGGSSLPWINLAANGLHVSLACHDYIETHRAESYEKGWLIRRNGNQTAAEVPVLYCGQWGLLANDGSIRPAGGAA